MPQLPAMRLPSLLAVDGALGKLTDAQKAEAQRRRAEGATLAELARSYDALLIPIRFSGSHGDGG